MEEDAKKLDTTDLLQMELLRTQVSLHAEASQLRVLKAERAERDAFLKALEFRNEKKVIDHKKAQAQAELSDLIDVLSEKYGLDLKKATYDDKTGVIYDLENS
jgi:hypothetical protein